MKFVSETVKPVPPDDARKDRWTAHRERRRREFVDAALRVLEAQGPGLLMDAVAAEAGVTKPVLYRYFSDKAALVRALDERGSQILLDRLLPAISAGSPILARIRDSVGAYFAVIEEHPNLYWLLARHANVDGAGPDLTERHKELIATTLTAVIGDLLQGFRPGLRRRRALGLRHHRAGAEHRRVVAAAALNEPGPRCGVRDPADLGGAVRALG